MTERVIVLGAGGHGQVIVDILQQMILGGTDLEVLGFVDDSEDQHGESVLGYPILGGREALPHIPHESILIAVGDNATRRDLFLALAQSGERFARAIHPRAVLAHDVVLGTGSVVMAGAIVNTGTNIAANVILNTGSIVDHHCIIAAHTHIAPGSQLGGRVNVGEGGFVGIGATVMPGCRIGAWSVVGAGALARHDVPAGATVVGIPAHVLEKDPS